MVGVGVIVPVAVGGAVGVGVGPSAISQAVNKKTMGKNQKSWRIFSPEKLKNLTGLEDQDSTLQLPLETCQV
jgi:hypothetical protein